METSAKDATNVEQAFMAMSADIKNRYPAFACLKFWCLLSITIPSVEQNYLKFFCKILEKIRCGLNLFQIER